MGNITDRESVIFSILEGVRTVDRDNLAEIFEIVTGIEIIYIGDNKFELIDNELEEGCDWDYSDDDDE